MARASYAFDLLLPSIVDIDHFRARATARTSAAAQRSYGKRSGKGGDPVADPSVVWLEMAGDWLTVRDLRTGTRGMRRAGERYLPKYPRESIPEYRRRLETSFLNELFTDTLDEMVSKPFSKALSFEGDAIPEWIEALNENVDGAGTTIHEFAKNLMTEGLCWGISHVAVDAVNMPEFIPAEPIRKDFEGATPRMRLVPGPNMLSWTRANEPARPINEVRFYERVVDAQEITELLHVWTPTSMTEYSRDFLADAFKNPLQSTHQIGQLPIATFYTRRTGEFTASPPFMDVAWLNVDHWQSYSDQRQVLHTARIPLLFRRGFSREEIKEGPVVVGARRIHSTSNATADMHYVEISGESMAQGDIHLRGLIEAAREKGSKPLTDRGPITATGEVRADSKATCDLQAWCEALERTLLQAYRLAWRAVPGLDPIPDDFRPRVFSDFDLRDRSTADLAGLAADRLRGDISRKAYLKECKRRGRLPEDYDIEADKVELDKEAADGFDHEIEHADAMAELGTASAAQPEAPTDETAPEPPKAKPKAKAKGKK